MAKHAAGVPTHPALPPATDERSPVLCYGAAFFATAAALAVQVWLTRLIGTRFPFATLFIAALFSAWYGGYGPAIVSVALGGVGAALFLLPWQGAPRDDFSGLILYTLVGAGIALLGGAMRSAHRAAEANAREVANQRERLRIKLQSIGDAVIATDTEGRVTSLNPAAAALTGWSAAAAQGRPLHEVFVIRNEDTDEPVENPADKVLREGQVVGLANHPVLLARDGRRVPIDDSAAPIVDTAGNLVGVVLVFRDVTDRRRSELLLRASEARKAAIVGAAVDAIVTIDQHGHILEINPAAEQMFGHRRDDVLGKQMAELIVPPSLRESHYRGLAHYLQTGEGPVINRRIEVQALRANGAEFSVELTVTPIPMPDGPLFTAYIRDISHLKSIERRRNARLTINQILATGTSVTAVIPAVLEAVCRSLDWRTGALWTVDSTDDVLRCSELWHAPSDAFPEFTAISRGRTFARGIGLPGRIWESGSPAWIRDVTQDANFPRAPAAAAAGLRGAFGFPVFAEGQLFGVIEFFSNEVREPDADLLEMVGTIGGQIGQFIERRSADEALRDSEQRFVRFMQHLPGLAWIKDIHGHYIYVNDAAESAFGTPRGELYGRTDDDIFPPATAAQFKQNDQQALASNSGIQVIERLEHQGRVHRSLVSKFPILGPHGEATMVGGMAVDISDRLQAEEALLTANRLKDEFLAMLAHELRNPLAPIRHALEVLRRPDLNNAVQQEVRELAERQVQHMAVLLDDLLDVSRISRGHIELRRARVEVRQLVRRVLDAVRPFLESREHTVVVALGDEPLWVEGDPHRLEQILTNLLNNSGKYTDPGGRIQVSTEREADRVILRVEDSGIGISPEMLPHIFDLFVQAERRVDRSQGGIGIGLTLVKRLIELHGGTVAAQSAGVGCGSTFVVTLPAAAASEEPEEDEPIAAAAIAAPAPPQAPTRRVLVVDDNHDAALMLSLLLRQTGHDVRAANDGPQALEIAAEFQPRLVLLDIGMPGMDGYEVARRLRQQANGQAMLIVALTGWGQDEDRRRSQEAGFDHHLVKPIEPAELERLLSAFES